MSVIGMGYLEIAAGVGEGRGANFAYSELSLTYW